MLICFAVHFEKVKILTRETAVYYSFSICQLLSLSTITRASFSRNLFRIIVCMAVLFLDLEEHYEFI